MKTRSIKDYIAIDKKICHGKPVFKGTRIMVHIVLEMLESGASLKEILVAYPTLTKEHIKAALKFAAELTEKPNLIPA